jgi:hypothetical protein
MKSIFCLLLLLLITGCNLVGAIPVNPDAKPDDPAPSQEWSEQDYWNEIAVNVDMQLIANTDELILLVDRLQKRGVLKDVARVASLREKRVDISADNKTSIATTVRGK